MPDMRFRGSPLATLLVLALFCTGCGSEPASAAAEAKGWPTTRTGTDEGAMSDLQASAEWKEPRCRWLETSAHIEFYPNEVEVLMAARNLGYVEAEQVGMGTRHAKPQPTWRVALTEVGKDESARCGKGSDRREVFGVPVSERRFIAGKRTGDPDKYNPDQAIFEVELEWMPTLAGQRVKHALTGHMTVEEGLATATVRMVYGRSYNKGPNGWGVTSIVHPRRKFDR